MGLLADRILKKEAPISQNKEAISLVPICEYLNKMGVTECNNFRIFTHNKFSSEMLYRTEFEVIGANFHGGGQAIFDNYSTMVADTDQKAFEILHERGIDLVLLCPKRAEPIIGERTEISSTFAERLCKGQVPFWLHKVQLPDDLSRHFLLFETNFNDLEHQKTDNRGE